MKELFVPRNFTPTSRIIILQAESILNDYESQGYRLSLRQLYYQFIARDLLPEEWASKETGSKNNFRSYKRLGSLISDARQAGLLDWSQIEDRNRETTANSHWTSPKAILEIAAEQFAINKWEDQPVYVEVMVEKDALSGILEPVCSRLDVPLTANKGYSSSSALYFTGKKLQRRCNEGKSCVVLYLGDHDPSGIDMTRDVEERLQLFSGWSDVEVIRLALNMDQVQQWNPPENPVKETDARHGKYQDEYGDSCWELDAIEPTELATLVEDAVLKYRDADLWDAAVKKEAGMKQTLLDYAEDYEDEEDGDDTDD